MSTTSDFQVQEQCTNDGTRFLVGGPGIKTMSFESREKADGWVKIFQAIRDFGKTDTTNDERGKYIRLSDIKATDEQCMEFFASKVEGEQPKREPLLSEADVERMLDKHDYRDEMDAMKELWRFYESKIASGELIRRDELEKDSEVGNVSGQPVRWVTIGRARFEKAISQSEYDELVRRGAKIIE
jgi:hypothetical protein